MSNLLNRVLSILCILIVFVINVNAQVRTKTFANGIPNYLIPVKPGIGKTKTLQPPPEFYKLKQQADVNEDNKDKAKLPRYSLPSSVDIDILKEAIHKDSNGLSTYSLTITAAGALSLSLKFSQFILSPNSLLSIYNQYELTDSITAKENNEKNSWKTRVYDGNTLNIVLKLPTTEKELATIKIGSVYFGYKKSPQRFGEPGASDWCNMNVACPSGAGWEPQRDAVAIIQTPEGFATGAMVMNTCNTNTPYLLTAHHVWDQGGDLWDWVFQFFYFSTACSTNTGYREDVQFNSAVLRATNEASDFALVQLVQTPAANSGIHYAGWSRSTQQLFFAVGLHHPNHDVMKISTSFNAIVRDGGIHFNDAAHWRVTWSEGITALNSSGSPLFDIGHRIIGQLNGGDSYCDHPQDPDYYGSFDQSWTGGGTSATRLSDWLDPNGTGAITTNTTNVSNLTPFTLSLSITGGSSSICTNGAQSTYTLNGAPAGYGIVWEISNPGIANLAYNGNQATVTKTGNGALGLTATVGGNCFVNKTAYKTIRLGTYLTSEYNITQWPSTACLNQTVTFSMPWYYYPPEPGTTYNWTWSGMTYISGQGTNVLTLRAPSTAPFSTPWVIGRANNSCGSGPMSPTKYLSLNTGCWSPYRVSPNPSSDYIKIERNHDNGILQTMKTPGIVEVQIIDKMGMVRLKKIIGKGQTQVIIPVNNLASDIYTLRIFDGQNWYSHKISILH